MEPQRQSNHENEISETEIRAPKLNAWSYLIIIFLCIAWPISVILFFAPAVQDSTAQTSDPITSFYLPTLVFQLLVLMAVVLVTKSEGVNVPTIGIGKFKPAYIIYAIVFLLITSFLLGIIARILFYFDLFDLQTPQALMPKENREIVGWLTLSFVVGFAEESAYRGYLITRLQKLTGSRTAAVVIACIAFAVGHLYQGYAGGVLIFFYGLMFAALFLISGSLWPGIIAHIIHNAMAPFAGSSF